MGFVKTNATVDFMRTQEFVMNVMRVAEIVMVLNIIIVLVALNHQNYLMEFAAIKAVMNVIITQQIHVLVVIMVNIFMMENAWKNVLKGFMVQKLLFVWPAKQHWELIASNAKMPKLVKNVRMG